MRNVRSDFPILGREINGRPLIYLDSAATSQKPRQVVEAVARFYREANANVHRGLYVLSVEATELYEGARKKVAAFIGASPEEVIFTRGTTESLNALAYSLGEARVGPGDEILVTAMEHHANLVPWQLLARRKGARLLAVGITPEGELDLGDLEDKLSDRTRVVAVTHVSNVLGTVNPIPEISRMTHEAGAVVVVDAAQSVPHMRVDVQELGCDFLAFSGHKMLGPTGVGVLWGRRELLEGIPPFLTGGEMIREVWIDRATWNDIPYKFEAGTPPIAQAVGLGAAVDYLVELGMEEVRRHEEELVGKALEGLLSRDYVEIYGPKDPARRGGVVAFNLRGIHPHDVATLLDQEGIAIRAGHHCAQPLHRLLGVPASCRVSVYVYNTVDEIEAFLDALDRVWESLGR